MSPAIRLEPLTPADGPYFYELGSDPQVARYMRFSPLTDPAQGDELAQSYTTGGNLAWRIVDAVSGRSAGVAALKLGDHEDTRRSVSLFLARDAWGRDTARPPCAPSRRRRWSLAFPHWRDSLWKKTPPPAFWLRNAASPWRKYSTFPTSSRGCVSTAGGLDSRPVREYTDTPRE